MRISKKVQFIVALFLFVALVVNFAAPWKSVESIAHAQKSITPCLAGEAQTGCPLFFEHLASWQKTFAAILPDIDMTFLTIFFGSVAALGFLFQKHLWNQSDVRMRFFCARNPESALFCSLRRAFARGILNTKAY